MNSGVNGSSNTVLLTLDQLYRVLRDADANASPDDKVVHITNEQLFRVLNEPEANEGSDNENSDSSDNPNTDSEQFRLVCEVNVGRPGNRNPDISDNPYTLARLFNSPLSDKVMCDMVRSINAEQIEHIGHIMTKKIMKYFDLEGKAVTVTKEKSTLGNCTNLTLSEIVFEVEIEDSKKKEEASTFFRKLNQLVCDDLTEIFSLPDPFLRLGKSFSVVYKSQPEPNVDSSQSKQPFELLLSVDEDLLCKKRLELICRRISSWGMGTIKRFTLIE